MGRGKGDGKEGGRGGRQGEYLQRNKSKNIPRPQYMSTLLYEKKEKEKKAPKITKRSKSSAACMPVPFALN